MSASSATRSARTAAAYLISGAEDFLRRQAFREIVKAELGETWDASALAEFDGRSAKLAAVLDECRTGSFFAATRLIVVDEADAFITAHRGPLEDFVDSAGVGTVASKLVLVGRKKQGTTKLHKKIEALGGVRLCDPPKPWILWEWVMQQARAVYGCDIEENAARRLVELVGDALGLLNMELMKLATYKSRAPRGRIEETDVEDLIGVSRAEKVFGITDALGDRDARTALTLWEQVLSTDRDAQYRAVGGLAWGVRRMIEAKRRTGAGERLGELMKPLGFRGAPAEIQRRLDRFTLRQWQRQLQRLARIDADTKTGAGDVQTSVEKMIVSLCVEN